MGLIVQKYGGSSVADAESMKRVASRIVATKKAGHQVKVQQRNPLIQDRINSMNACIEQRRVRVGNSCKHLIRTLEQHAYDDKGKPEKGGVGMDDLSHAGDAASYAIYRLAAIRQWKMGRAKARSAQVW